jgi:hypothetical protein
MRYFLISFSLKDTQSAGSLCFADDSFPSHISIEAAISKQRGITTKVIVHNFYEFKNAEDYNCYNAIADGHEAV